MGFNRCRRPGELPVAGAAATRSPGLGSGGCPARTKGQQSARQAQQAVKRYEIHWVRLAPVEGSEMGKTRPAVIVSLDVLNDKLRTVTICPITAQLHPQWRTRLAIRCAGRSAEVAVDQIRALAKTRIGPLIDALGRAEAAALRRLITEMYGEE